MVYSLRKTIFLALTLSLNKKLYTNIICSVQYIEELIICEDYVIVINKVIKKFVNVEN